jgi:hypothetical protein
MAKSTYSDEIPPEPTPEPKDPKTIPVPEGVDQAIFLQGATEAAADKLAGAEKRANPFQEGTHQAAAWEAGYSA